MTWFERAKLDLFRNTPDWLIRDDTRGKLVVNSYLNGLRDGKAPADGNTMLSDFEKRILRTPGLSTSIAKYLNGRGKNLVPELVERQLGDVWYKGLAKTLAKTSFGRNIVTSQILDKTLPTVRGDNSLAYQFLSAGGQV